MALLSSASGRLLDSEISKIGRRGLLRQQRAFWDLASISWDRGRLPLGLPKAGAAQLQQALVQFERLGPSGGWQFGSHPGPGLWSPFGAGRPIRQKRSGTVAVPYQPLSSHS